MKNLIPISDDKCWQLVQARDPRADGRFVYAVRTTGIFCRPSCRAKRALRRNVAFFIDAAAALTAGFRPCKRCRPDGEDARLPQREKIVRACRLLEQDTPVTLAELAHRVALSPYHLHRLFKAATGMTPKAWQQAFRARRLRESLLAGGSVTRAIHHAGFPDAGSYYRRADRALGMTATQFRRGGERLVIEYGLAECALGRCLVAESERGICAILLGDDDAALIAELRALFPAAGVRQGGGGFMQRLYEVIASVNARDRPLTLPLDIQGTAFQQQVWQALRAVPCGETVCYRQLASAAGRPKAARAAASACRANRLAIVIPCHRAVRGDGSPAGYRWGAERKARLLKREAEEE
ncbi:bifunctional DNA-binding transcriptional regulator/O6-methylguanine-DNA methyltransferase Ada [Intestinirhabdus alba]|uniref:Regulatory protein of adaptive response n=1 Tax=Intestinirhabdus alba TaxID=2899544 RepID=A0A6L6IN58_9ENTR|nr:bifunctional DNA-binding transcriptional regulator/O6-methylguanine-DNA methyltransferase Ada [Intestinirhabdus alba]MTH46460.1 bifunctional DNA-binding transcriptional regulator/O6-methylguanine-DNA methyltransferase Ada [Intestinirhabdus alba]